MAGMVRAIGATLMGAQNCLAKIKISDLQFLEPIFAPHTTVNCNAASTQLPYLMQAVPD